MKQKAFFASIGVIVLGLGLGGFLLLGSKAKGATPAKAGTSYEFGKVARGSIEKTISTSGTLEPVSTVSVLAEMSGRAEAIYADFNDRVKKGQVLVKLNTDMLELQRLQAAAEVKKAKANYDLQALAYQNAQKLSAKGLVSDLDLSTSRTSLEVYAAELASAEAALKVMDTKIDEYASVKSPIDGIVLSRAVDLGQSVVEGSSSNSTSLFTLAEDLSSMEIEATVDELDISAVKVGQEVRFTVDSRPGTAYQGRVKEIHLVPTTTNSVVYYTVIIGAANPDSSLLPGMTATISFLVATKKDVLLVPNSALRYLPSTLGAAELAKRTFLAGLGPLSPAQKAQAEKDYDEAQAAAKDGKASAKKTGATGLAGMVMGGGPGGGPGGPPGAGGPGEAGAQAGGAKATAKAPAAEEKVARKTLWYLDESGALQCVLVAVGVSDGLVTEVSGLPGLEELKIILKEKAE